MSSRSVYGYATSSDIEAKWSASIAHYKLVIFFVLIAALVLTVAEYAFHNLVAAADSAVQNVIVEQVAIRGNRRIPESTAKIWIGTREGDVFNPAQINRDLSTLLAQGHFEDIRVYLEDGARGGKIVTFEVKEWPLLLDIQYKGLKSIQQSTLLEEFRKRQVGLSKESQYDPVKVRRAAAVIKEMLANEGHPEASVDTIKDEISATAVGLTFNIEEGPRFRIAEIEFDGNQVFSDSHLRKNMKLVKEIGLFTTFTSKDIYHKEKLDADLQRVRALVYADAGYLQARFGDPKIEEVGKVGNPLPVIGHKGQGLKIVIPVTEGRQYRAGDVKVVDNTEFTADQIKEIIGLKPGDTVKGYSVVQKGMENLKKVYGTRGYIQFNATPDMEFKDDPADATKGIADVTFNVEEGKQYTLKRLEFIGNTFTRDNVIRREVLLNEGERYNQQLWDLSLLRLNQLGYFEQVKEEDATVNTNEREGQIDMMVKLQEKGRQQVSFTGGVSGAQGSFIGISYSTNNLFGYGESLSFSVSAGNQQQAFSLGITEPYLKGRPVSVGVNLFYQNYQFFGQGFGRTQSTADLFNNYGGQSLFTQKTAGVSVSTSAPLQYFTPRFRMGRFVRLGLSYTYSINDISDPDINKDEDDSNDFIPIFRQSGVEHSSLSPTISYNTLNSSLDPTVGQSLTLGMPLSGGVLGGDVNTLAPYVEWKIFRPLLAGRTAGANPDPSRTRTFGFRASFGHISPFGNQFKSNSLSFIGGTPTASRFYLGGEESIRGYNIRSIATLVPVEQTSSTRDIHATDANGNRLKVRPPNRGTSKTVAPSALREFDAEEADEAYLAIGGDTQLLFNFEYRIPLIGPLQFVPFADVGSVFNLRRLDNQFISSEFRPVTLNSGLPVTLNPRGELATAREIAQARTPETPAGVLPPGFRSVFIEGQRQNNLQLNLEKSYGGLLANYRYSVGGEFRIQVPVINVPFRLIFAWNPNAKVDNQYLFEEKKSIRFSIGRTF